MSRPCQLAMQSWLEGPSDNLKVCPWELADLPSRIWIVELGIGAEEKGLA